MLPNVIPSWDSQRHRLKRGALTPARVAVCAFQEASASISVVDPLLYPVVERAPCKTPERDPDDASVNQNAGGDAAASASATRKSNITLPRSWRGPSLVPSATGRVQIGKRLRCGPRGAASRPLAVVFSFFLLLLLFLLLSRLPVLTHFSSARDSSSPPRRQSLSHP